MALAVSKTKLNFRLAAVLATSAVFLATLTILGYIVAGAFGSMASTADALDDARAETAAKGALRALQKQLGATVRDNAYWDDAYRQMTTAGAAAWALDNWGSTTADYPLYDTAMVIEPTGKPLIAYHKGAVLSDLNAFYLGKLSEVLAAARQPDPNRDGLPVAFIRTKDGVAIIGAAAIQPSAFDAKVDPAGLDVLVFSKQFTAKVVAEVSRTFTIDGLTLKSDVDPARELHADVKDIMGRNIAYFTWPHVDPGTASYLRVRPIVIGAGVVLILLLAAVSAVGFIAFRALKSGERASNYKAKHDALTGLWNRAGCLEQIEAALDREQRRATSLHMLDLDGFKPVNDAWGHAVGDELIKAVAARLVEQLPAGSEIARLGGDEFAVIAGTGTPEMGSIARDILRGLSMPFIIGGRTIEISGSVGTAESADRHLDAAELLRRADLALYRAKDMGRGIAVRYDPSLDEDAGKNAELEQELRQALSQGQLRTVFQPLIDASTRQVRGLEALARWKSPTRGNVSPEVFIRAAEKAGLIDQLGFEVLRTTVREAARWPGVGVAVNVSPLQLRNPYFAAQVGDILAEAAFDPARLTIEVTEGVLISNPDQAKRAFIALRQLGVKIALDDFGSGFASIGALREFGFDRMKIDRSLIVALDHDDRNGAVLQATIALATALRLPVTAEGIETEEQAAVVRLSGCDELQGYLFGKPASAEEITSKYFETERALLAG
jgi:diguanylate cyclase (GGDEF)-like protein